MQTREDLTGLPKHEVTYLGDVTNLAPSGKYYTPWACSNVTEQEAQTDEDYWEELGRAAAEAGGYIASEGTDVWFVPHGVEFDL